MTQVIGKNTRVLRQRTFENPNVEHNVYAAPRSNLQTREGDWFRRDFGNVYQIDDADRNVGLAGVV